MPLDKFATPGNLSDLPDDMSQAWSDVVDYQINQQIKSLKGNDPSKPVLFFNELREPVPNDAPTKAIGWDGFPKVLKNNLTGDDRWRAAEEELISLAQRFSIPNENLRFFSRTPDGDVDIDFGYRNQDEYLEWFVDDGGTEGQIETISFTCEPPEYYEFIAGGTAAHVREEDLSDIENVVSGNHELLLSLYRAHCGDDVILEDLLYPFDIVYRLFRDNGSLINFQDGNTFLWARQGAYNNYNKWNTTHGIAHLTHPANTLFAEINLGSRATVLRKSNSGTAVTDTAKLICCSGYGAPNRSSDPNIGADVNDLSRQGLSATIADPVGLYINFVEGLAGFEGPNGEDVQEAWDVKRGIEAPAPGPPEENGMILRAEFAAKPGWGFRVDQMKIGGDAIRFGGQLADKIKMVLVGKAHDFGVADVDLESCDHHCCNRPGNPDFLQSKEIDDPCELPWVEKFPDIAPSEQPVPFAGLMRGLGLPMALNQANYADRVFDEGKQPSVASYDSKEEVASPAPEHPLKTRTRN